MSLYLAGIKQIVPVYDQSHFLNHTKTRMTVNYTTMKFEVSLKEEVERNQQLIYILSFSL